MASVQTEFRNAARIHKAITAEAEKRALVWMARRMPGWVNSDHLTALGFAGQIGAGIGYACAQWSSLGLVGACVCLALNWFGDSLDGTLARVRNRQRPRYGFYLDHVLDAFGATAMMCGLACSALVHWQIAMGMLVVFLLVSIESFLATYCLGDFHLSHAGLGPTEVRILLVMGNLRAIHHPTIHVWGHPLLLFDVGGAAAIVGMGVMAVVAAVRHGAQLYREERLPDRKTSM